MSSYNVQPWWNEPALLALAAMAGLVVVVGVVLAAVAARRSAAAVAPLGAQMRYLHQSVTHLNAAQNQLSGGLSHVSEMHTTSQTQMLRLMEERLEDVSQRMGESLSGSAQRTARSLGDLEQRLSVIDKAQGNIEKLSGDVLSLQDILQNKQTRGAFGEIQLQDLVKAALAPAAYSFQPTLSNGKRPDCLILLPDPPGPIAVDAKFPLEDYERLRAAIEDRSGTLAAKAHDKALEAAARAFKAAVLKHVKDIAERYILDGETADSALMFLPSEAVYAEIHANYPELARAGFEHRVWIVSPTTLMATLHTIRGVLKDARMREHANEIRRELSLLQKDVERLTTRVGALTTHFGQAEKDIREIGVSSEKAARRARRLEAFEFEREEPETAPVKPRLVETDAQQVEGPR